MIPVDFAFLLHWHIGSAQKLFNKQSPGGFRRIAWTWWASKLWSRDYSGARFLGTLQTTSEHFLMNDLKGNWKLCHGSNVRFHFIAALLLPKALSPVLDVQTGQVQSKKMKWGLELTKKLQGMHFRPVWNVTSGVFNYMLNLRHILEWWFLKVWWAPDQPRQQLLGTC